MHAFYINWKQFEKKNQKRLPKRKYINFLQPPTPQKNSKAKHVVDVVCEDFLKYSIQVCPKI